MKTRTLLASITIPVLLVTAFAGYRHLWPAQTAVDRMQQQFRADVVLLDSAVKTLNRAVAQTDATAQQKAFLDARLAYKQVEWLAEYYFPATAKSINGAPVPEYDAADSRTESPEGLQVIEPLLFPQPDSATRTELVQQTRTLQSNLNRLTAMTENNPTTDAHVFDALRLEVFRVITLGITGFDAPIAQQSLPEARTALRAVRQYASLYEPELSQKTPRVAAALRQAFDRADASLRGDLNAFDRLAFITQTANPLSSLLLDAQRALNIPAFTESRGLRADARTLFDRNAFDPNHYAPGSDYHTTPDRISLGKRLFYDPILSGNGTRSCASCHQPEHGFTDGLSRQVTIDGKSQVRRNTPTLWNVAFQRSLFADSRVSFLEDQATDVMTNTSEMHGSLDVAVTRLKKQPDYARLFAKTYARAGLTSFTIRNAIASYERSLTDLDSRVDRALRGNRSALTPEERAGFNLFAGKAKCATCHFLPLTNGTVPPQFERTESEGIGVPERTTKRPARVDPDPGKADLTGAAMHQYFFKTPTLRHVGQTAPYMHNGVYRTLNEVVDFYNNGGGNGMGFNLPNQTLSADSLRLTKAEKMALIAFMKAL